MVIGLCNNLDKSIVEHYRDKDNNFIIVIIVNFRILLYTTQNIQIH